MTTVDASAQFGGRDAAQAVMPYFRTLKSVIRGRSFAGFPFPELAFILRVDGEVNAYGLSGAGNIELDRKGRYVSVDIGITRNIWASNQGASVSAFVADAIVSSVNLLITSRDARLAELDRSSLQSALKSLAAAYKDACLAEGGRES